MERTDVDKGGLPDTADGFPQRSSADFQICVAVMNRSQFYPRQNNLTGI